MDAWVWVDQVWHLIDLQSKGRIFECLLHGATAKHAQISIVGSTSALGVLLGDAVPVLNRLDLAFELDDVIDRFLFWTRNGLFAVGVVRVATASVLLEDVEYSYFRHLV